MSIMYSPYLPRRTCRAVPAAPYLPRRAGYKDKGRSGLPSQHLPPRFPLDHSFSIIDIKRAKRYFYFLKTLNYQQSARIIQ
jgi:hypothetical protein